jgi:NAD(P)-dependent dehydrogenase (short-subunit alcohol dehydrogenase family)
MTHQRRLGSGFGAHSTASQVVQGIDLTGKLAIVTGGYSGLGLETTRALSAAGCHVLVPALRRHVAEEVLQDVPSVEVVDLDLGELGSVRQFAKWFLKTGREIDMIINNAAIMACPEFRVGNGWESHFAINHLGHYAMVNLLWEAIAHGRGARVVAVTSGGYPFPAIRWHDLQFAQGYDKWQAYLQSKRANALFVAHLDHLGRAVGVRAFSALPGYILTPLQRHLPKEEMVAAGWIDENGTLINTDFKTSAQGAATQVWAATSPRLAEHGGVYCSNCDIAEFEGHTESIEHQTLVDAARMWALSADLTGVNCF